jgi:hypothetical protein
VEARERRDLAKPLDDPKNGTGFGSGSDLSELEAEDPDLSALGNGTCGERGR